MLDWCHEEKIRCFVLSSMDEGLFLQQARAFGILECFEEVYAGVIDKRERIRELIRTHQLEPSTTAFLGDMAHDIATAKHGGIDSIALATGYDPIERLRKNEPTYLFDDLAEVREWLSQESPSSS